MKIHLKMSSAKMAAIFPGGDELFHKILQPLESLV